MKTFPAIQFRARQRQQGMSLLVVLILLVVMSILGDAQFFYARAHGGQFA
jgi:Tfp pilus assembly protein PilX